MLAAVRQRSLRLVKSALEQGLTPYSPLNEAGDTAVICAVRDGNGELLTFFLDLGGKKPSFLRGNKVGDEDDDGEGADEEKGN